MLTAAYGLLFLLLIVGAVAHSVWRQSKRVGPGAVWKRIGRSARWYLFRLSVTAIVAWVIAVVVAEHTAALDWVALWVGLYWLWKLWDRWRGKGVARRADELTVTAVVVSQPQGLPGGRRPLWRQVVHKTATLAAGTVIFIAVLGGVMILGLGYYERQAKAERNKVQIGMTVDEVLSRVHGGCVRAHAMLPESVPDESLVHYASFTEHPDGTVGWSNAPDYRPRQLTQDEAAELMKQKMSDGYEWRWRYTFLNDTPRHFSFTVTFGRDGRVKDVTDVWGWWPISNTPKRPTRSEFFAIKPEPCFVCASLVPDHLPGGTTIVELGCGTGALAQEVFHRGWVGRYIGIDLSDAALTVAKMRCPQGEWRIGNMRSALGFTPYALLMIDSVYYLPPATGPHADNVSLDDI
jgi:hypothetical protein